MNAMHPSRIDVFDSHCHLQDPAFDDDREQVYARARAQFVGMIVPGYSLTTSEAAVKFAATHEATWAMVGVHPHDADAYDDATENRLRELGQDPRVLGIGEIGLDFYYNNSPPQVQQTVLIRQLQLARDLNRPVSIHSRDAEAETLTALDQVPGVRGVLHCFTGSLAFAQALWERGFFTSFAGVVTFKKAHALREVVAAAPMHRILIETDSPYLTPVPWRGQRNEPGRVIRVAEVVAAQKNCSTKEVFSHTIANVDSALFRPQ